MSFQEKITQEREKYKKTGIIPAVVANDNEPEKAFNTAYFGIDNIKSFPACLDLRISEGKRIAMPYSYIMSISFDPDEGIEIITSTKKFKIVGRALGKLFDYLAAFRVRYIQIHSGSDANEDGSLFVSNIEIEELCS